MSRARWGLTGGTATVSVSLRSGGRTVAGPVTCANLVFREGAVTRDCGPRECAAQRGRTYQVAMTWEYTRDGRTSRGTAEGSAFIY